MKFSSEVKIGIIGIATGIIVFFGIKFLLGKHLLNNQNIFYATYDQVDGLESGAPINMQGFTIGIVDDVSFDPDREPPFIIALQINKNYNIRKGSIAEIYSADLLGSMAVRIRKSSSDEMQQPGDTLQAVIVPAMLTSLMSSLQPMLSDITQLTSTLDSVGKSVNGLLNATSTTGTLDNLNDVSSSLRNSLGKDGDLSNSFKDLSSVAENLKNQGKKIETILTNMESVSNDLSKAELDSLMMNLNDVTLNLGKISQQVSSGEGSAGKFIYNDSLYSNLSSLAANLDFLIRDINEHPEKYVRFSLFGK